MKNKNQMFKTKINISFTGIKTYLFVLVALFIVYSSKAQDVLIGQYEFTTGAGQLKATNVTNEVTMGDIYINPAKVTANYVADALETSKWGTSMAVTGGTCIQFTIAKKESEKGFKVSRVDLTLKRTGPANRLQLNYGIDFNPTLKTFSNTSTFGTTAFAKYSLTENTGTNVTAISPVINNSPQYFAIATLATTTSEIVTIDKIEVYGIIYANTDTVPVNYLEKTISVFPTDSVRPINPLFWGANFLFWVEDDASLADGVIEKQLQEMNCTNLRYPGGTAADNFHWKTNTLDNVARFPYDEGSTMSDFDEFMVFCNKVKAEPMLVVNTESWMIKQDLAGGVKEAVDWVQYCKDKGYKVRYWEIGNETYWHPIMTAAEYGDLVKTYSQAMKAVDPTIIISANGHWDTQVVGTKERTSSSEWETIRLKYLNVTTKEETKAVDAYADSFKNADITASTTKWWDTVAGKCANDIDMINLHWYFAGEDNMESMTTEIKKVQAVFSAKAPGKKFMTSMSEYNCNNDNNNYRVSGFIDGIGRFLNAGIDIADFWPMRNGVNGGTGSMFIKDTKEACYPYQVLKLFSNNLKGHLVKCGYDNTIFPFASYDGNQLTIVVGGRGVTNATVKASLNIDGLNSFELIDAVSYKSSSTLVAPVLLESSPVSVTFNTTGCTFLMDPYNSVVLRFKKTITSVNNISDNTNAQIFCKDRVINIKTAVKTKVDVYNIQGMLIKSTLCLESISIPVAVNGRYIVRLTSDNQVIARKVSVN